MPKETQVSIGLGELIQDALYALIHPFQAFEGLQDKKQPYPGAILFLFIMGALWINIHGYFLFTEPIWSENPRWIFYSILFGLFAVFSWLGAAFLAWIAHRFSGGKYSLAFVEQGTFYLIVAWALMPIFDFPHFFIPHELITVPIFGTHPLHVSHFFAGIVIPLELTAFFKILFPSTKKLYLMCGALFALLAAKFFIEDLGFLLEAFLFRIGVIAGKYDDYVFGSVMGFALWFSYTAWRAYSMRWARRETTVILGVLGLTFVLIIIMIFKTAEPKYPEYTSDSGLIDSSRDNIPKSKNFNFPDTIHFNFDPAIHHIKELHCIVRILPVTKTRPESVDKTFARCDIAPGPKKGEGEYILEGRRWTSLTSASPEVTIWKDPSLLDQLTTDNNDIRVHVETAPGDIVAFSGVWIEIIEN